MNSLRTSLVVYTAATALIGWAIACEMTGTTVGVGHHDGERGGEADSVYFEVHMAPTANNPLPPPRPVPYDYDYLLEPTKGPQKPPHENQGRPENRNPKVDPPPPQEPNVWIRAFDTIWIKGGLVATVVVGAGVLVFLKGWPWAWGKQKRK